VHNFRKLQVWRLSRDLGAELYELCGRHTRPDAKLITSQLRRAALSISANIAEGCGKRSRAETIRYLEIAAGSAAETEHHLTLAAQVGLFAFPEVDGALLHVRLVQRMLRRLIERLPE
jgi:four helix bundle protein